MIAKRFIGLSILSEALSFGIIVFDKLVAFPTLMAFDAKMVIGITRQITAASTRLQHSLRQRNAGWYFIFTHFINGYVTISRDITLSDKKGTIVLGNNGQCE